MDEMIAADAEAIAVAGCHPHAKVGARNLQAGSNRRCAAMDSVKAVGVHIIGEPAGTSDAGDKYHIMPRNIQLGHNTLYLCKDGIIAATRAPSNVLIRLEILRRVLLGRSFRSVFQRFFNQVHSHLSFYSISSILSSISMALKGSPWTLFNVIAGTRYFARISFESWPRLSSGIKIFLKL